MREIKFYCPFCRQSYQGTEEHIGMKYSCTDCGKQFVFTEQEQTTVKSQTSMTKNCPFCGEKVLIVAKKCKHCGEFFNPDDKPKRRIDRQTYIWLAILFGNLGVHNFYAKQYFRGIIKCFYQFCISAGLFGASFVSEEGMQLFLFATSLNTICAISDCFMKPEEKKDAITLAFNYIVGFCFALMIFLGIEVIAMLIKKL